MHSRVLLVVFSSVFAVQLFAQQQQPDDSLKVGDVTVSGWLRSRGEVWDWFEGNANNKYAFSENLFRLSFSQNTKAFDWKIEAAVPFLLAVPNNAVAAGSQGQLGFGGTYYAVNRKSTDTASVFPKQVYMRFKFGSEQKKQSLLVGRSEFFDGAEAVPKNKTLASLKADRIAQRLIGNFSFSDVGRSFDGGVYSLTDGGTNVTLMASRPTRGVFQVDGWNEIDVNLFYGALTRAVGSGSNAGDFRVFAIGYEDYRDSITKVDNRSAAAKAADHSSIDIATFGADYIHALETPAGTFDLLLWGAGQTGSWGTLTQRAYAYAAEGGWQLPVPVLRPWLRGGYDYGSGDGNPKDGTHGTFFQILPTARQYARFPFFNMMNTRDAFGELVLRPAKSVAIRTDIHSLALANKNDLWYSGGGAYDPWIFGYTGRPSNGQTGLATLFDTSFDYTLNRHLAFTLYYAYAAGKLVIADLYPKDPNANFGYMEVDYRF